MTARENIGKPKFSFVIPTYNRARLLAETLACVFEQTYKNHETIIVDDGSTDETVSVAKSFGDRVNVFSRDHGGCAAARNYGVSQASGDYIFFLDSDDLLFPWTLKHYANAIEREGWPTIVAGELIVFRHRHELDDIVDEPCVSLAYENFFTGSIQSDFFFGTGVCAVLKSEFQKVGGFIERDIAATDSDLQFRLGVAPGFVKIDKPFALGYRDHDENILKSYKKVFGGAQLLIVSEKSNRYPGGEAYRRHREKHIGVRARAMSLKLVRNEFPLKGMQIYFATFPMNFRNLKWKYLLALPVLAVAQWISGSIRGRDK
ncbi:putative glycosyltransferase EpsE [Crateriforma conspicua]|uniref:Putative glycosyltransferase EpsE n=2 Tax=Crateriforma conspicua TaxID=2527996 RepID=A0A5C6FX19_9PLAN|nr:putative glycosyltransferase EpsE [Crateriforma conspicua]